MTTDPLPGPDERRAIDRRWRIQASAAIGAIAIISFAIGFLALPAGQGTGSGFDPFAAMCRAIGIRVPTRASAPRNTLAQPAAPASRVVWTTETRALLAGANVSRGATIVAQTCATCHGKEGIAIIPLYPNLAHQPAAALFKQLLDFKSSSRQGGQAAVMAPFAAMLNEQQMADVSAYFASRSLQERGRVAAAVPPQVLRLVTIGDPKRALPPCDACHGDSSSGPEGAPTLHGQSSPYLEQKMQEFATGERRNDLFARMRTIARQLTPDERRQLADYYGVAPTERPGGSGGTP